MKKRIAFIPVIIILSIMAGIIFALFAKYSIQKSSDKTASKTEEPAETGINWKEVELTDVTTGEKFKISDFTGKNALVESFAVWCPVCLEQQKEIKKLETNEDVVLISVDTDPNEDEDIVKDHVEENDFDWHFAVGPAAFTKSLISDFGYTVVNAPGAPVILVCEDGKTRFLPKGVKSSENLISEIEKGC